MKSRNLLWQIPILFAVLSPLWWGGVADFLTLERQTATTTQENPPDSSFTMLGVILAQAKGGKEDIRLHAERMYSEEDQSVIFLRQTKTALLGKNDSVVNVTGGEAIYDTKQQILTLLEDVTIVTDDNTVVNTPVMRYLSKYKKLKSAAEVELLSEGMSITGTSFMYDLLTGNLRVGRRVHCKMW